jgi:hypothetical protein
MDYPHPLLLLDSDGTLDFSQAYDTGIGEWDLVSIRFGYSQPQPGADEENAIRQILDDAFAAGHRYITDADSRPVGGASPHGHLWDSNADAVEELKRISHVREASLTGFSEAAIPEGQPLSTLEEALVPVYLLHRYQVQAAAKVLGGLDYRYALRGEAQPAASMVDPDQQIAALDALIATLQPDYLRLPESVLQLLPPRPPGYPRNRETFPNKTGVTFDPLAAASSAADHTLSYILHPHRAARLIEHHARQGQQPGLAAVLNRLIDRTAKAGQLAGMNGELQRVVNHALAYRLMVLASHEDSSPEVKAVTTATLESLSEWLDANAASGASIETDAGLWAAHHGYLSDRIAKFLAAPHTLPMPAPAAAPPGQPIGCGSELGHF